MQKKRILHCVCGINKGGLAFYLLNVLQRSDKKAFQMDVCVIDNSPGELENEIRATGSEVIYCPGPAHGFWNAVKGLRKIMSARSYDAVIVHRGYTAAFALWIAWMVKIPVRVCLPHSLRDVLNKDLSAKMKLLLWLLKNATKVFATHYMGISNYVLKCLFGSSIKDDNHVLVPCGVNLADFDNAEIDSLAIKQQLGIPANSVVVGNISVFGPFKNHTFFIDAAVYISERIENVKFLFVGKGQLEQQIKEKIQKMGLSDKFIFAGWRDDVANMLSVMDVMLFPSLWEGFPIAVIEANVMGVPVAVSDLPLFDESLSPEAQNCRFPLDDPQAAADIICDILSSKERYEYFSFSAKKYGKKFSIDQTVENMQKYLCEIA